MFKHVYTTHDNFQMCFEKLKTEYKSSKQQGAEQTKMPMALSHEMTTSGPKKTSETPSVYKTPTSPVAGEATAEDLPYKTINPRWYV